MFRENWCENLWCWIVLLYDMFFMISNSLMLLLFCACFVKMHFTVIGGCHFFLISLCFNKFTMFSYDGVALTKTKRKRILYFIWFFLIFRENWCEILFIISKVRLLCILYCVFDDFEFCLFNIDFVNVLRRDPVGHLARARPMTSVERSTSSAR